MPLWGVPITGLLTSAGLAGLVLGLAAQSTLANIFGGVALTIDRTYKIGDYIVLDDGRRGRVSEIGLRSTRILTRDEVEITIPNALIANSKVINQTGRRSPKMRIRVPVGVAYGSDIERVRQILLEIPGDCQHTVAQPEPRVRFRALGDSSLKFELLCWIPEPSLSGRTLDELLCKIYQRFQAEGIVIPFPQRDLHLRDWPVQRGDSGA
ncbi:MAG TPA: mechanosensitive ion channel family protein [Candidatus Fraserbacteria bacterium]|nr:mechanosensitive ion channel family protein [Candidatus Fraserbacteria bacterium]